MTELKNIFFFILASLIFANCENEANEQPTDGKRNIKSYYFPVDELKDGKVYEYQAVEDPRDPPFYWYFQTIKDRGDTYLIGTYYGHDFMQYQMVQEEMVSNGMLLSKFFLFEKDNTNQAQIRVPVNIKQSSVFGFELSDPPSVLVSSINWRQPSDTLTKITFIRNRQYEKDTTYSYQNKEYDCVKFYVRELVDNEKEGHLEIEYEAAEIYAKDIGLIYFQKNLTEDRIMKYRLTDIYDMKTFEEKYRVSLQSEGSSLQQG